MKIKSPPFEAVRREGGGSILVTEIVESHLLKIKAPGSGFFPWQTTADDGANFF